MVLSLSELDTSSVNWKISVFVHVRILQIWWLTSFLWSDWSTIRLLSVFLIESYFCRASCCFKVLWNLSRPHISCLAANLASLCRTLEILWAEQNKRMAPYCSSCCDDRYSIGLSKVATRKTKQHSDCVVTFLLVKLFFCSLQSEVNGHVLVLHLFSSLLLEFQ